MTGAPDAATRLLGELLEGAVSTEVTAAAAAADALAALGERHPDRASAIAAAVRALRAARTREEVAVAAARAQRLAMQCVDDADVEPPRRPSSSAERRARREERKAALRAKKQEEQMRAHRDGRVRGLDQPVETLPGVGRVVGQVLRKRGLETVGDLLLLLPRRYDDERAITPIGVLEEGVRQVTVGTVASVRASGGGRRRRVEVSLEPLPEHGGGPHGVLRLVWFRTAGGLVNRFERGMKVRASGLVDSYRGVLQMVHPDTSLVEGDEAAVLGIAPRYADVLGVAPRTLKKAVAAAVQRHAWQLEGAVPEWVRGEEGIGTLPGALEALHFPPAEMDDATLERWNAHDTEHHARLAFEEFFLLELALHRRRAEESAVLAEPLEPEGATVARAVSALPFELTAAQQRVLAEISADLRQSGPMRRLLQGDVGSGKTAVAMLAAAHAVAAGAQVAFMAPTEILAEQHFRSFEPVARALGLRLALLVGGARASHRRKVLAGLSAGTIDVAVGTHALLTEGVRFARLRLVMVDEQHRFGVAQRLRLVQKGEGADRGVSPHLLVMTATPIPRSLALALYGDLDASVVDEMPPGRIPPVTRAYERPQREEALRQLERALEAGGQAYLICPLVEESEESDLRDATSTFDEMRARVGGDRVELLHGRLADDDRRRAMSRFASGEARVLVATTVVEVGVDVPAANLVLIEHAERFGLAQLHQLRGRVGRGGQRSACLLVHEASRRRTSASAARESSSDGGSPGFPAFDSATCGAICRSSPAPARPRNACSSAIPT
jgi:ATP-dependent DNA helicase RecG